MVEPVAAAGRRRSARTSRRVWRSALLAPPIAGALLLGAACSSGGGESSGPGTTSAQTVPPTAPAAPAASSPGAGTVVVGGASAPFEVIDCRLEPDPAEPEAARALLTVTGAGSTSRGDAFTVEVQRFATTMGETTTFTDTITYEDPARILQAQRIEVGGQVTDLRDPSATSALLRPRADGVSGTGLASAPGDGLEQGGVVGLAVDATCP